MKNMISTNSCRYRCEKKQGWRERSTSPVESTGTSSFGTLHTWTSCFTLFSTWIFTRNPIRSSSYLLLFQSVRSLFESLLIFRCLLRNSIRLRNRSFEYFTLVFQFVAEQISTDKWSASRNRCAQKSPNSKGFFWAQRWKYSPQRLHWNTHPSWNMDRLSSEGFEFSFNSPDSNYLFAITIYISTMSVNQENKIISFMFQQARLFVFINIINVYLHD